MPPVSDSIDDYFLEYDLPPELIAQVPVEPRDSARLMVVDRSREAIEDRKFADLPSLLDPDDILLVNDSRVLPARLSARRATGGHVEILLLERTSAGQWLSLVNPLRRLVPGERLGILSANQTNGRTEITYVGRQGTMAIVEFDDESIIEQAGTIPLPPYIATPLENPDRYQTVYAETMGSAAAPTAGLHFSDELLARCEASGIGIHTVTLHVGVDTFRPMTAGSPGNHEMHSEWYSVPEATWAAIDRCRSRGGRVVSVGTTVTRVLETIGGAPEDLTKRSGRTELFIVPPFQFRVVDAQITNFHLPRTTLLLLVGAFAGTRLLRRAYRQAIERRYRFYSFGDAMLIV